LDTLPGGRNEIRGRTVGNALRGVPERATWAAPGVRNAAEGVPYRFACCSFIEDKRITGAPVLKVDLLLQIIWSQTVLAEPARCIMFCGNEAEEQVLGGDDQRARETAQPYAGRGE
jgi:hypothetical protein